MNWIKLSKRKPEKEDAYFAPSPEGIKNSIGVVLVRYRNGYVKTIPWKDAANEYNAEHWMHFSPPPAPKEPFDEWFDIQGFDITYRPVARKAWEAAKSMD